MPTSAEAPKKFPPPFDGETFKDLQSWYQKAGEMIADMKNAGAPDEAVSAALMERDRLNKEYLGSVKM